MSVHGGRTCSLLAPERSRPPAENAVLEKNVSVWSKIEFNIEAIKQPSQLWGTTWLAPAEAWPGQQSRGCETKGEFRWGSAGVRVGRARWVSGSREVKPCGAVGAGADGRRREPREPELLHGFLAALRKLERLLSDLVTSHGENDIINKGIVWREKKKKKTTKENVWGCVVLRYALERSLETDQSSGCSRRASCALSWPVELLGSSWDRVLACKHSLCRAVVGWFCVYLLLNSCQSDFLPAGFLSSSSWDTWVPWSFWEVKWNKRYVRKKKKSLNLWIYSLLVWILHFWSILWVIFFFQLRQILQHWLVQCFIKFCRCHKC